MIVITLSNPIIMQLYWSVASKESSPSNLLSALRACRKQQFPNVHHPSNYDSLASNELRGRALHQWTKEAKNVPQVNNDRGKDEWIGPASCT